MLAEAIGSSTGIEIGLALGLGGALAGFLTSKAIQGRRITKLESDQRETSETVGVLRDEKIARDAVAKAAQSHTRMER